MADLTSLGIFILVMGSCFIGALFYYLGYFDFIKPRFNQTRNKTPYISVMYTGTTRPKMEVEIKEEIFPVKIWEVRKGETDNPVNYIEYYSGNAIEPISFGEDEYEYAKLILTKRGKLIRVRVLGTYGITLDKQKINDLTDEIDRKEDIIDDLRNKLEDATENEEVRKQKQNQKKNARKHRGMEERPGRPLEEDENEDDK